MEPTPGEPWVETSDERALALVGVGARAARRSPRSAVGAYFLLAGKRVDVPNLVGPRGQRGGRLAARPRARDRVRPARVRRRPARRGDLAGPGGGRARQARARPSRASSPPARARRRCRPSRASPQDDAVAGAHATPASRPRSRTAFSDSVPEGDVISTSPEGGEHATKGRTVTLTVSKGVGGRRGAEARRAPARRRPRPSCRSSGLTADVTEQETTQPPGTVMKQDPPTGTSVDEGRHGQAHRRQGTARGAGRDDRPPDRGRGHRDARGGRLQGAGAHRARTRRNVGRVIDQSPAAGTRRSTGATVTIYLGSDPPATPTPTPTPPRPRPRRR